MSAAAVHALTAERYAAEDAATWERLYNAIHIKGRCRYCRKFLTEGSIAKHPGVCGNRRCKAQAKRDLDRTVALVVEHLEIKSDPRPKKRRRA